MSAVPFEYILKYDVINLPSRAEVERSMAGSRPIAIGLELFGGQERVFCFVKLATCQYSWESEDELRFEGWCRCAEQTCRVSGVLKFSGSDKGSLHF